MKIFITENKYIKAFSLKKKKLETSDMQGLYLGNYAVYPTYTKLHEILHTPKIRPPKYESEIGSLRSRLVFF